MTVSQDENTLAQGMDEKMTLEDEDPPEVLREEVSTSGSSPAMMVCTAESCSAIPLQDNEISRDPISQEEKQPEEASSPTADAPNQTKMNKKNNRKKNKNKGGGASSSIQQIHTQTDLNKVLQQNDTVLLEFVTTWCTACHGIQPLYEELAQRELQDANGNDSMLRATQVVCDKNKETKKLADMNGVGSYPVFVLFENGREVNKWKGADVGKLEKAFDNYGGGGGSAFGGGKRGKGGKGKKGKGRR